MDNSKNNMPKFVARINNEHYPSSWELNEIYRVLLDADAAEDGDLRVIDESREDYLYPESFFVSIQLMFSVCGQKAAQNLPNF